MKKMKKTIRKTRKNTKNDGYILIDVVITIFVVSVAFVAIISGFAFAGKVAGRARDDVKNTQLEKNEFEKIPRFVFTP
jgi:hypothetical protein